MNSGHATSSNDVAISDPLPDIPPALLNSADIAEYVNKLTPTLFQPFNLAGLKPATYEVAFEGDVYRWLDDSSKLEKIALDGNDALTIEANSIIYVCPATYFRVPHFLALRFNLHINLVHRGLLLGTGPVVDPGFAGRLLIPVHNLTSQPLIVHGRDGFIWVEVTKISPVRSGTTQIEFDPKRRGRNAEEYLKAANGLNPIVSTLRMTSIRLQEFAKNLEELARKFGSISVAGVLALVVALASLGASIQSLLRDTHQYVNDVRKSTAEEMGKLQAAQTVLTVEKASAHELKQLQQALDEQKIEIEKLRQERSNKTIGTSGAGGLK